MYVQAQLNPISRFSAPEGLPDSSCCDCLEALVARTAELLRRLERENRCRLQRNRYRRALPAFKTAAILQVK